MVPGAPTPVPARGFLRPAPQGRGQRAERLPPPPRVPGEAGPCPSAAPPSAPTTASSGPPPARPLPRRPGVRETESQSGSRAGHQRKDTSREWDLVGSPKVTANLLSPTGLSRGYSLGPGLWDKPASSPVACRGLGGSGPSERPRQHLRKQPSRCPGPPLPGAPAELPAPLGSTRPPGHTWREGGASLFESPFRTYLQKDRAFPSFERWNTAPPSPQPRFLLTWDKRSLRLSPRSAPSPGRSEEIKESVTPFKTKLLLFSLAKLFSQVSKRINICARCCFSLEPSGLFSCGRCGRGPGPRGLLGSPSLHIGLRSGGGAGAEGPGQPVQFPPTERWGGRHCIRGRGAPEPALHHVLTPLSTEPGRGGGGSQATCSGARGEGCSPGAWRRLQRTLGEPPWESPPREPSGRQLSARLIRGASPESWRQPACPSLGLQPRRTSLWSCPPVPGPRSRAGPWALGSLCSTRP